MIVDSVIETNGYDPYFKTQLIPICNAAIVDLNIMGIPTICDSNEYEYEEYIPDKALRYLAEAYVATYVKLRFDPPANSKQIEILVSEEKKLRSRIKDLCEYYS